MNQVFKDYQLYNIRTDLDKFAIHEAADVEAFANEWFSEVRYIG